MLIALSTLVLAGRLVAALSAQDIPAGTPVSSLLRSAQGHLSRGETSEALLYYNAAVERDPGDYLTFFKRATTYLSLGRSSQATDDFTKVLSIKPDFDAANIQLGKIRQRVADWDGAREHFHKIKGGEDKKTLSASLDEAEVAERMAELAEKDSKWEECVREAGVAILVANRAASLRSLRSRCRFARGEIEEGLGDLLHVLQLQPGDVTPHLVISAVNFYALGDLDKGLAQARKCLQSDPDSKPCRKLLRQEKAAEKVLTKVDKAFSKNQPSTGTRNLVPSDDSQGLIQEITEQDQALREAGTIPAQAPRRLLSRVVGLACQGYYEMNNKKAKEWCDKALELDGHSLYGLINQHRAQLNDELFDAAIATLNKAKEAHPDRSDIIDPLMNEAQVRLKRSKTKDYYKVLGVAHDADEKQIKAAYRRLAKQHHPDKAAAQGLTKEDAEKKMQSINEAYEVLGTPELRDRFDHGDDPMSNEQHNPYQGNPFGGGGGQPFMFKQGGGGGQQFKFQFGSGGGGFPGGFPFGG